MGPALIFFQFFLVCTEIWHGYIRCMCWRYGRVSRLKYDSHEEFYNEMILMIFFKLCFSKSWTWYALRAHVPCTRYKTKRISWFRYIPYSSPILTFVHITNFKLVFHLPIGGNYALIWHSTKWPVNGANVEIFSIYTCMHWNLTWLL